MDKRSQELWDAVAVAVTIVAVCAAIGAILLMIGVVTGDMELRF